MATHYETLCGKWVDDSKSYDDRQVEAPEYDEYNKRLTTKTKSGNSMSRMAHMELLIRDGIQANLGDMILYVNNGTKASHGDVQKVNEKMPKKEKDAYFEKHGKMPVLGSHIELNCYRIDPSDLENNPTMKGQYNIQRAIATFNKRVEPLLVVFKQEVRNGLLVKNPEDRPFFTKTQCQLVRGFPRRIGDQDTLDEVLTLSEGEVEFWSSVGIDPFYMYLDGTMELVDREYVEKNQMIMSGLVTSLV